MKLCPHGKVVGAEADGFYCPKCINEEGYIDGNRQTPQAVVGSMSAVFNDPILHDEYVAALKEADPIKRAAWLYGEWEVKTDTLPEDGQEDVVLRWPEDFGGKSKQWDMLRYMKERFSSSGVSIYAGGPSRRSWVYDCFVRAPDDWKPVDISRPTQSFEDRIRAERLERNRSYGSKKS